MAKINNKQAAAYAKPHTMSAGDPAREDVKTSGIKMRGTGAATKGTMSRGPMG